MPPQMRRRHSIDQVSLHLSPAAPPTDLHLRGAKKGSAKSERRKLRSGDFSTVDLDVVPDADGENTPFGSLTVTEPKTEKSHGLNTHTTYVCDGRKATGQQVLVERRYTDFVSLQGAIRRQYPALKGILPAVPEKKVLGKFKSSFIEKRRLGLQDFLEAVVANQANYRFLARYLNTFMDAPAV